MTDVSKSMADIAPARLPKRRRPIAKVSSTAPIPETALGNREDASVTTPLNEKSIIAQ